MKLFKKVVCIGLVACSMLVALSACGSSEDTTGGSYTIGTDISFPPFEMQNDGTFEGIDIDLLKAISTEEDFKYEVQALGFNASVAALESGQVDAVIAGMTITDQRKEKYDFSDSYYESGVIAAVKEGNSSIISMEDLKGKQVAVKTGTQGALYAESKKSDYDFNVIYFEDSPLMYEDVKTGNSAACFEDYAVMAYGVKQGNGLQMIGEQQNKKPYGLAVLKGKNTELIEKFNAGLKKLKENGEYDTIINKYTETETK